MESLDWQEGETIRVALLTESELVAQDLEPFLGPEPTVLPEGVGYHGTLEAGDTLEGEIGRLWQFKQYRLVVEPGKRYRVDVKGAATGDGTLSDPWISGIKGAFVSEHRPEMQPVWYDVQGRTMTQITLPSGEEVQLDQYGRMFTVQTDSEGQTVLRPPMGANDDGGEGFNARLYLVNFPATEYLVAVSGAPNPSGTGTFTISLTGVPEDDYSADTSSAGALIVGDSASGGLETPGDADWFAVELTAGVTYVIEVRGEDSGNGALEQPRLAGIFDGGGQPLHDASIVGQAVSNDRETSLEFTPGSDGTHYIGVAGPILYMPNRSSLPVGSYSVSVNEGL